MAQLVEWVGHRVGSLLPRHWGCTRQHIPNCQSHARLNGEGCISKGIWPKKLKLNQICESSNLLAGLGEARFASKSKRNDPINDYREQPKERRF